MSAASNINSPQPLLPVFTGEGYEFWSIRVKTVLRSHDLWECVTSVFNARDTDEARLRENRRKDARALALIQQAVHDNIFSRFAAAETASQAWTVLETKYKGDSKVLTVKLQRLRREFETLQMKDDEAVSDFLSRVMSIVNQKKAYGEDVSDQLVVEKVLRSLPTKWDDVVTAIEESKDLSTLSFDQLMGSLQSHEARVNRSVTIVEEERALQAREVVGSGNLRGRGRSDCWFEPQVNTAVEQEDEEDECRLFMAVSEDTPAPSIWFVDSGCSNHMTGQRSYDWSTRCR
ncbi:uncharacterized protein LOC143629310 [Bidens hawaiensis]|uniref:uncharacterized protein LOC143629310 n=1 Tax=Bidens hawaiensis TaxID=980011 RepID=UPI00404A3132